MPGDGELTSNIKKTMQIPGGMPGGGGGGMVTGGIEPGIKFVRIYTEWNSPSENAFFHEGES